MEPVTKHVGHLVRKKIVVRRSDNNFTCQDRRHLGKTEVITSKFRFHSIAIYALGCFHNFSCTPVPTQGSTKEFFFTGQ